jgi:hypothetical protein
LNAPSAHRAGQASVRPRAQRLPTFVRDFPVTLLPDCCAAQTRRLHELSLEVLSSYRLAQIESITAGFDLAAVPVTA